MVLRKIRIMKSSKTLNSVVKVDTDVYNELAENL